MSRFAYESNERLIRGHVPQIRTARDLLRHLGVEQADHTAQSAAVGAWLAANEPDDLLAASLAKRDLPVKRRVVVERVPAGGTLYLIADTGSVVVYGTDGTLAGQLVYDAKTVARKPKQLKVISTP